MKKLIKRIITSNFFMNTGWIVFAQIYQMITSLVIGVISARYLGPSNYGIISYAASFVSFFTIFSALGLEGIVVKDIVSNRDKEGIIIGSSIIMRILAGMLSMLCVCLIVMVVNPADQTLLLVAFLQSIALLFNAFTIIDTWYQSYLKSKISTIIKCCGYTVVTVYKIILLVKGKSVEWFAFSSSLDSIVIALLFLYAYKKQASKKLKASAKIMKKLIKSSYHLIISGMMAVIYSQMDRIMIGKILNETQVGYYTAAASICNMWIFIPQALANSARPVIMSIKNKDKNLYIKRLKQLNFAIFWIGFIFAVVICLLSRIIIMILYGTDYIQAEGALVLIIWSTIFSSLSYARAIWMICENKQRYTKYILVWGVVVNLVLNYILIKLIGINGAAIATLITEVVCCFVAAYFYKDTRQYVKYLVQSIFGKGIK